MSKPRIRPLALCVFFNGDKIFVGAGYDRVKEQAFYRPLGGGIEFGEPGRDAVVRELQEEIGAEIQHVRLIDTLENIFTYEGEPGHEIVQIYAAEFANHVFYDLDVVYGQEDDDHPIRAVWKPLSDFTDGGDILYPTGLLKSLQDWIEMIGMLEKHYQPEAGPEGFDWAAALADMRE